MSYDYGGLFLAEFNLIRLIMLKCTLCFTACNVKFNLFIIGCKIRHVYVYSVLRWHVLYVECSYLKFQTAKLLNQEV